MQETAKGGTGVVGTALIMLLKLFIQSLVLLR